MLFSLNELPSQIDWSQGIVYCITNSETGERYIGATSQPELERFENHVKAAMSGVSSPLYRAMRACGKQKSIWRTFRREHVASCLNLDDLAALEHAVIIQERPEYNRAVPSSNDFRQ